MKLPKFLRGDDDSTEEAAAKEARRQEAGAKKPVAKKPVERDPKAKPDPKAKRGAKPKRDPRARRDPKAPKRDPKLAPLKVKKLDPEAPARKRPASTRKAAAAGTQARRAGAALGSTLKEGAEETRGRTRAATPGAAKGLLKLLGAVFAIFFNVLGFFLNILLAAWAVIAGPGMKLLRAVRRIVDRLSRLFTPSRALTLVVIGATVLLALSQFADYRSVSIGTDEYTSVETVAPAPEINREPTGEAHSYVFVPVAAVCLLLLGGALRGRWRLCRLIALAGVAAIVVALVIDRPAGLDPGNASQAFEGVKATLLGGFYAQIFAGLLLAISSLMLGRELRLANATAPSKATKADRKRRTPGPARRGPRTEGAQA